MVFWRKLFKKKECLGIDLGTRDIKAMLIKAAGDGLQVESTGTAGLPPGTIDNGEVTDTRQLAEVLQQLRENMGVSRRQAVTAVTGKQVITRHVKLPPMPETEVAKTLRWEAEKYVPFAAEELIIEYINFGLQDDEEKQLDVLLVAAPKKNIYQYYEAFSLAGWELTAVEIVPVVLWRLLQQAGNGTEPTVVVDIGAKVTNLIIVNGKRLEFSRSFGVGGDNITELIADKLHVDFAAADRMKCEKAAVPAGYGAASSERSLLDLAVLEGVNKLVYEIRRSIDYYKIQSKGNAVSRVFLTGGTAGLQGLVEFLQYELDLRVELLIPPLAWAEENGPGREKGALHPSWAVAVGLAMRGVV